MPGLVPGTHVFSLKMNKTWMAGSRQIYLVCVGQTMMPGHDES
jgi:hypothetical protein